MLKYEQRIDKSNSPKSQSRFHWIYQHSYPTYSSQEWIELDREWPATHGKTSLPREYLFFSRIWWTSFKTLIFRVVRSFILIKILNDYYLGMELLLIDEYEALNISLFLKNSLCFEILHNVFVSSQISRNSPHHHQHQKSSVYFTQKYNNKIIWIEFWRSHALNITMKCEIQRPERYQTH